MQTTDQQAPPRTGLFRRILFGDAGPETPVATSPDAPTSREVIDIRPITPPDLGVVYFRLERIEGQMERMQDGLRLIAQTMKRACGELKVAMEGGHPGTTPEDVERIVGAALQPLKASLQHLSGTVQAFPHLVAAAATDLSDRIDAAGVRTAGQRMAAAPRDRGPSPAPPANPPDLPASPFELEPFGAGFDEAEG